MPVVYPEIEALKERYLRSSFVVRAMYPSELARMLANPNSTPLDIFLATMTTTPFQQRSFAALNRLKASSRGKAWASLYEHQLLRGDSAQANFDAVAEHPNPEVLAHVLDRLHMAGLLTGDSAQANFNAVVNHQNIDALALTIDIIQTLGHIAQPYFNYIIDDSKLVARASGLQRLQTADMLKGEGGLDNLSAVGSHSEPEAVAHALQTLHTGGSLTADTRHLVVLHPRHQAIADVIVIMSVLNLFDANRTAILDCQRMQSLASALKKLMAAGLLTEQDAQANFNAIISHPFPDAVASALIKLHQAGVLTTASAQSMRDMVNLYPHQWGNHYNSSIKEHPDKIASGIIKLWSAGLFTPENIETYEDGCRNHYNPVDVASAIIKLHTDLPNIENETLASACRDAIFNHHFPTKMIAAIVLLKNAGLLVPAYLQAIKTYGAPVEMARAIIRLHDAGLLLDDTAQANLDALRHSYPESVAQALIILHSANLLNGDATEANRNAVTAYDLDRTHNVGFHNYYYDHILPATPIAIAQSIIILQTVGLLTNPLAQTNRAALMHHNDPRKMLELLQIVQAAGLLTGTMAQANFDALKSCAYPSDMISALQHLHTAGLLTGDEAQTHFNTVASRQLRANTYVRNLVIRQQQTKIALIKPDVALKTDAFQEPVAPRYIYVNPKTNRVHLMMPVVGGTNIGVDNTCKSVYALQEFWGKSFGQQKNSILDELNDYRKRLEFDINLIPVNNELKQQKQARLQQIKTYIDAVKSVQQSHEMAALTQVYPAYPEPLQRVLKDSNLYSMHLRPVHMDQYIRSVNPVFSVERNSDSILCNALVKMYQTIPIEYLNTGAKNSLVAAVLASPEGQQNDFTGMQRVLTEQTKKQLGVDIDFYNTTAGGSIAKPFIDKEMGFDTFPASASEYIDALIYYGAGSLFDNETESPFNATPSQDELYILTQFFLAEINIYCKEYHLSSGNFGLILDGNELLSIEAASIIRHAFSNHLSVEKELCRFINTNMDHFHLTQPLSVADIKNIDKNFVEHYAVIKDSPHFDEFSIPGTKEPGAVVIHQGSICIDFSELIGEGYTAIDNSFFSEIRLDFQQINGVVPHNNEFILQNMEPIQAERIAAINNGLPLGFVVSRLSSEEQVELIKSLSENITSVIKNWHQLTHVVLYLSSEGRAALFAALMSKLSEIVQTDEGLSVNDIDAMFKDLTPELNQKIHRVKQVIETLGKIYPNAEVRAFTSALISDDHEKLKREFNHLAEHQAISSTELIASLTLDPVWMNKINLAIGEDLINAQSITQEIEHDPEQRTTPGSKTNHVGAFKTALDVIENRNTEEDMNKQSGGPS